MCRRHPAARRCGSGARQPGWPPSLPQFSLDLAVSGLPSLVARRTAKVVPTFASELPGSDLLDLTVFELHRSGPPENRNFHLEPCALLVDFLDDAIDARNRAVGDAHLLAPL